MDKKLISRRVANNMLEFLYDPTKIPVDKRLYFRSEEILQNQSLDKARAEGVQAYHDQKKNSDFYPTRNIQREASLMDRRTLIASLGVLSQSFVESDPIGTDLRTMAYAVSGMTDEELSARLAGEGMSVEAKRKVEMVKCPECGTKVLKATGYCLKCKAKTLKKDKDEDDDKKDDKKEDKKKDKKDDKKKGKKAGDMDFWSKAACEAVQRALIADVCPEGDEPKQPVVPEEKPEEKKVEEQPVVPPAQEEEEKPAKQECKAADAPAPVPTDAPAVPTPDAPAPTPVPAPEDKPKKKKDDEDKDDKEAKVVDTNVLVANVEGIEMLAGMVDVGDLTAAEKAQLDQLFS